MNTVINHIKHSHTPELGDIYQDEHSRLFILAQVERDSFAAICIADGNRYLDPTPNKRDAISLLTFVARDAKIMINLNNGAQ